MELVGRIGLQTMLIKGKVANSMDFGTNSFVSCLLTVSILILQKFITEQLQSFQMRSFKVQRCDYSSSSSQHKRD